MTNKDVITDVDVAWVEMPERHVQEDVILDVEDLFGKAPKRTIAPNRPIKHEQVQHPPIIHQNDAITLVFQKGTLDLKTAAYAMQDGGEGDVITVRNADSHHIVRGNCSTGWGCGSSAQPAAASRKNNE